MRVNPPAARCIELARYIDIGARQLAEKSGVDLDLLRDWWMGFDDIGIDEVMALARALEGSHPSPAEYIAGLMDRWPYRKGIDVPLPGAEDE